jgi:hypothetical protein
MGKHTDTILHGLDRLDASLLLEGGRVRLLRRWLHSHASRLDDLSSRIDASLERIDTLLGGRASK